MRIKKATYLCTVTVLLMTAGCGSSDTDLDLSTVDTIHLNDVNVDNRQDSDAEEQNVMEVQGAQITSDEHQETQEQTTSYNDEELEEKLVAYREAREEAKPISLGNGVVMGGTVNPEEYGISFDISIRFDTEELTEAIETADSYVENTLGISVETEQTTYMCVDPRIYAIYSAEDKGAANGYESENIYFREYCDNGTWQYLILVRDGKGSSWKVIHHGSSYMAESEK